MNRTRPFPLHAGVRISGLIALSAACLCAGASAYAGAYPPAPPGVVGPSLSLVPRPIDPNGFDVTLLDVPVTPDGFDTFNDPNADPNAPQSIVGPDDGGTVTVGTHTLSLFGALFNNKTGLNLDKFDLFFTTPASLAVINVDTDLRNDDLTFPEGTPTPTWNIEQSSAVDGDSRLWHISFLENPNFPWSPAGSGPYTAFTVLGSGFAPDTNIQFTYVANAPEPGTAALAAAIAAAGISVGLRRRRKATK